MLVGSSALRLGACLTGLALLAAPCVAQDSPTVQTDTMWVTVHDHRMAFFVTGRATAPVIVLEPGGSSHLAWGALPSTIATFARVVTYDRPGYGLSAPCPHSRSAAVIARELREALSALRLAPPFVLGGWSLGGSFARVFAATFPDAVAGVVLIDPAPEEFYRRAAAEHAEIWTPMLAEQQRRVATREVGHQAEWAAWDETMRESRQSDAGLVAPVILLTATLAQDALQPLWIAEHGRWAARLPNVRHVLVDRAGHAIHRDRPDAVVGALRELLAAVPR